jgi:NAD(P)-dependent dehydrogenase (short-subunit alcohol dehydrogenase family)
MGRGAVFITGASTGIGRTTATRLATAGYDVIPGLRRDEPLPKPVLAPVILDLADRATIGPACEEVIARANGHLVGLINNAGVMVSGPFETVSLDDWRLQFEVNLFGHLAITNALLPSLRSNAGRVITVGAARGRVAAPYMSPYISSKFALRGWMDGLRIELAPQGIKAILIEPGAVSTPLWDKENAASDEHMATLGEDDSERYAGPVAGARKSAASAERHAISPEDCAKVIEHALTAKRPQGRYLIGPDAHLQAGIAMLPTRLLDGLARRSVRQSPP